MLRLRSPQRATLAPDGSARPDCKGCYVRRGGKYRTLHTEKSTQRGDGALPLPTGRGLRADREGQRGKQVLQTTRGTNERRWTWAWLFATHRVGLHEVHGLHDD